MKKKMLMMKEEGIAIYSLVFFTWDWPEGAIKRKVISSKKMGHKRVKGRRGRMRRRRRMVKMKEKERGKKSKEILEGVGEGELKK